MNKKNIILLTLIFFIACDESETKYMCDTYSCVESEMGPHNSLDECLQDCSKANARVTVFIYENCPIAQYMCGPLRDAYRYFCDTLGQEIIFRGFSPNSFSTESTLENFQIKYDVPFDLYLDFDSESKQPGDQTQFYGPIVTPEVFVEVNEVLVYRGMIDNSYQSLGQWALPTENYLVTILTQIVNEEDISYFETEAVGCLINY
jgi:hypothetical protein